MRIRTSTDLGAVLRERRKQLKLDQATFAKQIGVSRPWVIEVERGHPRAELALVLRALDALDIELSVGTNHKSDGHSSAVDIDDIVAQAKKGKP